MEDNKTNWGKVVTLGGAFIATCIGSGFATGSEFLSFFVAYGVKGALLAILISFLIYFLFTNELYRKGQQLPEEETTSILSYYFGKKIGNLLDWYCAIFVGGCYLIMLSGAGTTLHEYLGWPVYVGSILMAAVSVVTVLLGLRRLTNIIGVIGPVIAVFSIIIGAYALVKGFGNLGTADAKLATMNSIHPVASNAVIAGILYPCFAMLTLTPVLPSMGKSAGNKKTATGSAAFGSILFHLALLVVVLAILGNLNIVADAQVPNLALSRMMGPVVSGTFVVMIFLAIYSTACPMMWGFTAKFERDEKSAKYRIIVLLLTVVGMIASYLFPLGTLINFMYGISGYVGAVVFVGMIISNIMRKGKTN